MNNSMAILWQNSQSIRYLIVRLLLCVLPCAVSAEVMFSGLTINEENQVLFTARNLAQNYGNYSTAFTARIEPDEQPITQLSFYPEQISYIPSTEQVQIVNRFGIFRSSNNFNGIRVVENFPSFVEGANIATGKIQLVSTSPNGQFMVYVEPTSPAYGNLILRNFATNTLSTISSQVEIDLNNSPASWNSNSDFFIYHKGGSLYYFSIRQFESSSLFDEQFRIIGKGKMSNISWGDNNEIFFLNGNFVYQILSVELLIQPSFLDLLRVGRIIGSIPTNFDPNFDRFWISPNKTYILVDKNGQVLNLYPLNNFSAEQSNVPTELPYLYLPNALQIKTVLWPNSDVITILARGEVDGHAMSRLYRLNLSRFQNNVSYELLDAPLMSEIILSPSALSAVVLSDNFAVVYSYNAWLPQRRIRHDDLLHFVFINESEVILAGKNYIEYRNIATNSLVQTSQRIVALSQAEDIGFSSTNGEILIKSGQIIRGFNPVSGRWFNRNSFRVEEVNLDNQEYRVFYEQLSGRIYGNTIRARNISGSNNIQKTRDLVVIPEMSFESFPEREQIRTGSVFDHGSRLRKRNVSFVFNAINSYIGLNTILQTLDDYNIQATFFLNGEFIRRYPYAVREIDNRGHELGSLFDSHFDFASSPVKINDEFVFNGLINNEELFYEATGKELSNFWHAPYYFVNPDIITITKNLDYTYIGRDVDTLDWISAFTDNSQLYSTSAEIIERVLKQKKPGSIISMTVGIINNDQYLGTREDYLFNNLEILINNLINQGYSVVPVSTLIKDSQ